MKPPRLLILVTASFAVVAAFFALRPGGKPAPHATATPVPLPATTIAATPDAKPSADVLGAFDEWLAQYRSASHEQRASIAQRGLDLAKARRGELKQLIQTNPKLALDRAVPVAARQQLPPGILAELEERVNTRGFFGVLGTVEGSAKPIHRTAKLEDGRRFEAFVYGRRAQQRTTEQAFLNGIALDDALALDERPLRVLEAGERPDPSKPVVETCPVSGQSTTVPRDNGELPAVSAETPAVEAGGTIHYLCSGGHIAAFEDGLVAGEGSTGGGAGPTGGTPDTHNTGPKTHLYIRVTFPDQLTDPQDERSCYDMMRQVNDFMVENSFGKCYFITTVTPLLVLPRSTAYYNLDPSGYAYEILDDARVAAKAAGYDWTQYDFDTVRYSGGPGGFGGQAYVGSRGCWLKSSSVGVAVHEYGHNLGLWHANYWNTSPASTIGPGANSEYGNSFDTMGAASAGNNHFGAYNKSVINWLTPELVTTVTVNGTYRVFAHDKNIADPANRYALRVRKDVSRNYWLEFRQKFTTNAWMMSGLQLTWDAWGGGSDTSNSGSNGGPQLLDFTPGSPDAKTDAMVVIGRTFTDPEAGVHVTPIGKGGTTPESLDVVVNLGAFPTNQAPTLSVGASATSVAASTNVTFTATASDPDSDPLAYAWDFGDKTFATTNAAVVTKSWATAGIYNVRCVVSDMKGKVAAQSVIVTVGAPGTFTISGTITASGAPVEGVLVSNGLTNTNWRGAYTDSNGFYTIPNLAAGNVTVSAQLFGYALTADFTNPVTVGPNATGKNFTAAASTLVTLEALDAVATEGADTGTFRISRTGSTATAAVLRVFNPTGTATRTTDYALAPNIVSNTTGTYDVTIPIGASFVDLVLTPVNDTTAEGPETAILQLVPTAGHVVSGAQSATVTLDDNDTTLPRVSIAVPDQFAHETGDAGQIVVARTGSTAAALTVQFARTGTAANGTDYTNIGTSVVIPAGAASAAINITPLADTLVEGNETVTITVSANAAYVLDTTTAQTVTINDDDVNVLSVTATDNTANENGDPGVFTLVRTGDLTNALSVDYTLSGTALPGTDYHRLVGAATFLAGESVVTVTIRPIDDAIGEAAQTVLLTLRCNTLSEPGSPMSATLTINDNDLPTLSVTPVDGLATEPASGTATDTARFRIYRNGGSAAFTAFFTIGGNATPGTDYTAITGSVAFTAGETTKDITVTPLADTELENTETVTLTLTPDAAYVVEPENTSYVHLVDEDQVNVSVSAEDVTVAETSTQVRFYISRSGTITTTTPALDVNYTMGGSATTVTDYTGATGVFQIPVGAVGAYLTLTPVNDTLAEGTETIVCTIAAGAYGTRLASATHLLGDNDTAGLVQVSFSAASSTGAESVAALSLPVTLSAAAAGTVTVNYTMSGGSATAGGVDYTMANGTLQFTPGVTAQNIPLTVINDIYPEGSETIVVTLSAPNGAILGTQTTHTYTITDNDTPPAPTVAFTNATSAAVESNASPASLLLTLSAVPTSAVSVTYTATGGTATATADFSPASGTLNFASGEVTKHLPLAVVNDGNDEGDETIVVTLSAPSGATLGTQTTHTYTITNDDQNVAPVVTLTSPTVSAVAIPAGVGLLLEATVTDDGKPVSPGVTTSAWTMVSGPGTVTFGTPSQPNTTALFSANGSYVLRLTANDSALTTTRDVTVHVGGNPPFTGQNINAATPAGSHSGGGASYTVNGGGANISGTSDQFYFLSQGLTGDGEMRARITSMSVGNTSAKAGVMLRGDTTAGSRMAYMSVYSSGTSANSYRTRATDGASTTTSTTTGTPAFPMWVRVVRAGSNFTGYTSTDGSAWTQVGSTTAITANATMLAGLAVGSADTAALCTAVFDNVTVSSLPTNLAALVNAGPDASAAFPAAATLSGSSSDDGLPAPPAAVTLAWSKVSGPGSVTFGNAASASTTATFSTAGSYVLRLTAHDGQVKTFDDMTATSGALPTVTVTASDSTATENELTTGAFTLARTGDTSATLTVHFTIAGSATSGADFTALGTSAVIDAGQASKIVVVTPLADALAEGAEDVTLTLTANAAYIVGAPNNATVSIDDLPIDAWRFAQFGANANNPAMSGDLIDWEGDGANTLLEYATGTNALTADAALPVLGSEPGFLTLTYRRFLPAANLVFTVEETLDFSTWTNANPAEEILSDNGTLRVIKARVPMGAGGRKALHLKVTRP